MTEQVQEVLEIPNTPSVNVQESENLTAAPSEVPTEPAAVSPEDVKPEPTISLTQSELNRRARAAKLDGYNRGRREMEEQFKQSSPGQQQTIPGVNPEELSRAVRQEMENRIQLEMQNRTVLELQKKMVDAKSKYKDFDEVIANLEINTVDETGITGVVLQMSNQLPNSGDVLYELAKHPEKLGIVTSLLGSRKVKSAMDVLQKLSSDIAKSEAKNQKVPPEPLSQLQPSNIGLGDGKQSIKSRRNDPDYRM